MKSKLLLSAPIAALSPDSTAFTPSACAAATFSSERVNTVTSAPIARASLAAMSPSPPKPTMPTASPAFTPQCRSGEKVVTPAHRIGAAVSGFNAAGTFSTKSSATTIRLE